MGVLINFYLFSKPKINWLAMVVYSLTPDINRHRYGDRLPTDSQSPGRDHCIHSAYEVRHNRVDANRSNGGRDVSGDGHDASARSATWLITIPS